MKRQRPLLLLVYGIVILFLFYYDERSYYILINVTCFGAFVYDKQQSLSHGYRVAESILLGFSALGGWIGGLIAIFFFQHKLKKLSFMGMYLGTILFHVFLARKLTK